MNRISFPGIAQAWIARGNGKALPEFILVHTIGTFCDIAFIGDVNPTITFAIECSLDSGNVEKFHNMLMSCSINKIGDVNPIINMSMFCFVSASNP